MNNIAKESLEEHTDIDRHFLTKLLKYCAIADVYDILYWNLDFEFYINCNDMFYWATAEGEKITPDTLPILEQALKDCNWEYEGFYLYCARMRKMRPQQPFLNKEIDQKYWELFNQCGPERNNASDIDEAIEELTKTLHNVGEMSIETLNNIKSKLDEEI